MMPNHYQVRLLAQRPRYGLPSVRRYVGGYYGRRSLNDSTMAVD